MSRAPLPQQDPGEWELPPQGPPWRAGGPATLRVLILTLLWRGSLAQLPGFTLTVPQSVSVQEGLCVLVPCTFTYPASYDTDNPSAQLYGAWYKEPATVGQDPPVASSATSQGVSQETQGRFRLTGDPARGDCSLQISDARRTDAGRYFFNFEKGLFEHTYRSNSDGTDPALTISVPDPPGPPNTTGNQTSNGRPGPGGNQEIIGMACGLVVLIGLFLLGLYVIKLRGREPAPPSAEAGETANGSQVEHTASEASVIYSTVTHIPMHHKTPAARRTKGVVDGSAAAQAPLGPGKPDELHYASVEFSRLQRKGGEPSEAAGTEYSEIRRK